MAERKDDQEFQAVELHLKEAMYRQQQEANKHKLQPKRSCHNCEEKLSDPYLLFCDSDCRTDFDKRAWARRQNI